MDTSLKKLPSQSKPTDLNFKNGFNFGLGFWLASAVFFMIILPILACASFVTLSMFGAYITEALGR